MLNVKLFFIERVGTCLMYKKNVFFLLTFFGHVLIILAWTKCRLVTKHVLSITHFHSCFFLTFPFKFYLCKKFKFSIKDYLLLYTFMCIIILQRITILNFQSHQIRILSAGLSMAWNRDGLSCKSTTYVDPPFSARKKKLFVL